MPRYDMKCRECGRQTIILCHEKHDVDPYSIECEFCKSHDTQLIAYFFDERYHIEALQREIEELTLRIARLDENGYD